MIPVTDDRLAALRAHPEVAQVRERAAVTLLPAGAATLTAARAEFLVRARLAGLIPVLLGPAGGELSIALRGALADVDGAWVVGDRLHRWNGLTGVPVADLDEPVPEGTPLPAFLAGEHPEALQVHVAGSLRHRAGIPGAIGRTLVEVGRALDRPVTTWGPHEPLDRPWNDHEAAALLLRAPRPLRVLVGGDRQAVTGSLLVRRTRFGAEELVEGAWSVGPPEEDALAAVAPAVHESLRTIARTALPLVVLAFARPGRADLAVPPLLPYAPAPLGVLIGPPGVRDLGLDIGVLQRRYDAVPVGRPRVPGLLIPFAGDPGEWERLHALIDHLGPERVQRAFHRDVPGSIPL